MQKSTLAILLGATGAILGLKALYKVYKLDYELSDTEDEDEDVGFDESYNESCDNKSKTTVFVNRSPVEKEQLIDIEKNNTNKNKQTDTDINN